MEEALRAALLAATAVTNLVGPKGVDWGARPQGKGGHRLVLHRIGGRRERDLAGPNGLIRSRVQVDCLAPTFKGSRDLARAVEAVLGGYDTAPIQVAEIDGERSDFLGDAPEPLHVTRLDLMVWHT